MSYDALGAYSRDELGISDELRARPIQAALASAAGFGLGTALPLLLTLFVPDALLSFAVASASLLFLAVLGAMAAQAGGVPVAPAAIRGAFWGALAMAITAGVGTLFEKVV